MLGKVYVDCKEEKDGKDASFVVKMSWQVI